MRTLLGTLIVATAAMGAAAPSAHADSTIACPLFQATRTIVDDLPPGWSTDTEINPVTNYRVDTSSGQQVLICEYGESGAVQRAVPFSQNCAKIPGRKFKCVSAPPPGPAVAVVSDGPITITDNGVADLDAGGPPDIRLRADNPFLRTLNPISGAKLSPQGTHLPSFTDCQAAPYSPMPIPQSQLPVGVWVCVTTSEGNFGRIRIANINGIPGLPLPMTIYLDHTTWAASGPGGPGGGPGGGFGGGPGGGFGGPGGGFGGPGGGFGGPGGGPGGGFGGPGGGPGGGFGGGPAPHSTGTVVVSQTYSLDLDEGQVTSGPQSDLWFEAVTAAQLYLKPMNGAQLAVGNKLNRGYNGCSAEAFSPNQVALNTLPVGSFICAATNQGRVSQFRINGLTAGVPKNLTLAYITWD